jgi:hypothetical protein
MNARGGREDNAALNGSTTHWSTPHCASSYSLSRSVAMRAGCQLGLAGHGGKVVARVRLKRHDAAGHAAVLRLVSEQCQHGLVATVHAVEVADGQRAGWRKTGMVEASEHENRVYCAAHRRPAMRWSA